MRRVNEFLIYLFVVTLVSNDVTARPVTSNTDDTDTIYITDEPSEGTYAKWDEFSWRISEKRAKSWRSEVYHSRKAFYQYHSVNHGLSSAIIELEDSTIARYDHPRSPFFATSVGYEICLYEDVDRGIALETFCELIDAAGTLAEDYYDVPTVISKAGLRYHEYRKVISLADELDELMIIEFSRPIYTTEPPTPCNPSKLPIPTKPREPPLPNPLPHPIQHPLPGITRRSVYRRFLTLKLPKIGSFTFWVSVALVVIWIAFMLGAKFTDIKSRRRERRISLARVQLLHRNDASGRPPPIATHRRSSSYYTPPASPVASPSSIVSGTSTIPPSYADVIREQEQNFQ